MGLPQVHCAPEGEGPNGVYWTRELRVPQDSGVEEGGGGEGRIEREKGRVRGE